MRSVYFKNDLHPRALYLRADSVVGFIDGTQEEPRPPLHLLQGVDRLRLVIPETRGPLPGWHKIRTTTLRTVSVSRALKHLDCANLRATRSVALDAGHPLWKDWIALHWEMYKKTHTDNPPRPLSLAEQQHLFAGADLPKDGAFASLRDGKVVAFASVRLPQDGSGPIEFGWIGKCESAEYGDLLGLICRCLVTAQEWEFDTIELEADDTDDVTSQVLLQLPSSGDEVFQTWQRMI